MQSLSVFILPVLACVSFSATASDLLDVYWQARANDPDLSRISATTRLKRESVSLARAKLLPVLGAQYELSQNTMMRPTSRSFSSLAGHMRTRKIEITLRQALLDSAGLADMDAARASSDAQGAVYEAARLALLARVAGAYLEVLVNEDVVSFSKSHELALRHQLNWIRNRFDVGLAAVNDVHDVKARYDTAVSSAITSQNKLSDSREALTQITGKPMNDLKKLSEVRANDRSLATSASLWSAAVLRTNLDIVASQYSLESAKYTVLSTHAARFPTAKLSISSLKSTRWYQHRIGATLRERRAVTGIAGVSIDVTFRLPLFLGDMHQSRVRRAIVRRDAYQNTLDATRLQVARDLVSRRRRLVADVASASATKSAVKASESTRDATLAGFQVGTRTVVDVLLSERNLFQSLKAHSLVRHRLVLDELLLRQVAGVLDLSDLERINRSLQ